MKDFNYIKSQQSFINPIHKKKINSNCVIAVQIFKRPFQKNAYLIDMLTDY